MGQLDTSEYYPRKCHRLFTFEAVGNVEGITATHHL